MSLQAVLLPLFVEVTLTFALLCGMAVTRGHAVRAGLHWRRIALGEPHWPSRPTQFAKAFSNQFELPLLFYLLTVLAWITKQADLLFVVLAWLFVLARLGQAFIHVTDNHVPRRAAFYALGALVLMSMWLIFMVRLLLTV